MKKIISYVLVFLVGGLVSYYALGTTGVGEEGAGRIRLFSKSPVVKTEAAETTRSSRSVAKKDTSDSSVGASLFIEIGDDELPGGLIIPGAPVKTHSTSRACSETTNCDIINAIWNVDERVWDIDHNVEAIQAQLGHSSWTLSKIGSTILSSRNLIMGSYDWFVDFETDLGYSTWSLKKLAQLIAHESDVLHDELGYSSWTLSKLASRIQSVHSEVGYSSWTLERLASQTGSYGGAIQRQLGSSSWTLARLATKIDTERALGVRQVVGITRDSEGDIRWSTWTLEKLAGHISSVCSL